VNVKAFYAVMQASAKLEGKEVRSEKREVSEAVSLAYMGDPSDVAHAAVFWHRINAPN
jgi:hypothetical protein